MKPEMEAFLDIETTGLQPDYCEITVVGIYLTDGVTERCVQIVGEKICGDAILESLDGVQNLYTYNGHRFDLPFIHSRHGVNLESSYKHCDLMHHCWRKNLYGGLKAVERSLGIERRLTEVNGLEAIRLWWRYVNDYDRTALQTLLEYNKEDIVNLKILRDMLIPGK
jgi:uncharacterized protein YprB with RNaseH-like and TPR domain